MVYSWRPGAVRSGTLRVVSIQIFGHNSARLHNKFDGPSSSSYEHSRYGVESFGCSSGCEGQVNRWHEQNVSLGTSLPRLAYASGQVGKHFAIFCTWSPLNQPEVRVEYIENIPNSGISWMTTFQPTLWRVSCCRFMQGFPCQGQTELWQCDSGEGAFCWGALGWDSNGLHSDTTDHRSDSNTFQQCPQPVEFFAIFPPLREIESLWDWLAGLSSKFTLPFVRLRWGLWIGFQWPFTASRRSFGTGWVVGLGCLDKIA